jgi:hypothetical protein
VDDVSEFGGVSRDEVSPFIFVRIRYLISPGVRRSLQKSTGKPPEAQVASYLTDLIGPGVRRSSQ